MFPTSYFPPNWFPANWFPREGAGAGGGRGFQGAGRRLMYHIMEAERQRVGQWQQEAQARAQIHDLLLESRWQSFEAAKRQILVTSMYSTLLSEV